VNLATVDIAILVIYAIGIFRAGAVGVARKGHAQKDAQDYFLARARCPGGPSALR
jgi:hypothetical protein